MIKFLQNTFVCLLLSLPIGGWAVANDQAKVPSSERCQGTHAELEFWRQVRQNADAANASELLLPLAYCLQSPNAELRDRIGYEVLTYWMRSEQVSSDDVAALRAKLIPWLAVGSGTSHNDTAFARAFAALVLSETVRFDINNPSMTASQVDALLQAAITMMLSERDYRGLTQEHGWIHTIAHGADLLWRLAMHNAVSQADQHRQILNAVSQQITRADIPAYTFNEFDRLARVVAAVAARDVLNQEELVDWVTRLGAPGDLEQWGNAFASPSGMAQLHNQKHFIRALSASFGSDDFAGIKRAVDDTSALLP